MKKTWGWLITFCLFTGIPLFGNDIKNINSNESTIIINVILQTHESPFKEFQSTDVIEKVKKSQNFIINTLNYEKNADTLIVMEGVFINGNNLQPKSIDLLQNNNGDSFVNKVSQYGKIYGFENIETHSSGLILLRKMLESSKVMLEKSSKMSALSKTMQPLVAEMKVIAPIIDSSTENPNKPALKLKFERLQKEFKVVQKEFQFIQSDFLKSQDENRIAQVSFNAFRVKRSAEALQAALQVAITNNQKKVFLIIGSLHWIDLLAIENQIDTVKPRLFKLIKME
jgi:hypothetical protein